MSSNKLCSDASTLNPKLNWKCPPECIPLFVNINIIYTRDIVFGLTKLWFSRLSYVCIWLHMNDHIASGFDTLYLARKPNQSCAMSLHVPCLILYVCVVRYVLFFCHGWLTLFMPTQNWMLNNGFLIMDYHKTNLCYKHICCNTGKYAFNLWECFLVNILCRMIVSKQILC